MLEQLADHDDELARAIADGRGARAGDASSPTWPRETGDNLGVSVLFGSAASGWGVRRLLKALRHEAPGPGSHRQPAWRRRPRRSTPSRSAMAARSAGWRWRARSAARSPKASDLKTRDGEAARLGALFAVQGEKTHKIAEAGNGDVVAVAKVDERQGRRMARRRASCRRRSRSTSRRATARFAIEPADRKDDVKLSGALQRLLEEDATLILEHDEASHEMRLRGVNDEHLNTVHGPAEAALRRRGDSRTRRPIGYRESIRRPVTQQGRHKKQSGGHGQFGDVDHRNPPAAARRRLPVRGEDPRRRDPAAVDPGGRAGRQGRHGQRARSASRWSMSR